MTDQLELGACGHTTRLPSYGGGTIGAENISGPGAIGVAPDPTSTYLGGADMPQGIKAEGWHRHTHPDGSAVCWPTDQAIARREAA